MTSTIALPPLPTRTARNASLADLIPILEAQNRHKLDLVVPLSTIRFLNGSLELGAVPHQLLREASFDETGVTPAEYLDPNGSYRVMAQADKQLSQILDIPLKYVKRLREEHVPLLDTNVNEWTARAAEDQKVLVRALWGTDEEHPESTGIIRAILSSRYGVRDNLDVVLACLDGMREAGLGADKIRGADLTDDRMWFRIEAPELTVAAPKLLEGYQSPFKGTGHGGASAENPVLVHAGLLVTNSETGFGAVQVIPELRVKICDNGMQITTDAMRRIHLGQKLDEGQIIWSDNTKRKAVELMKSQMVDAIKSFMSVEYVQTTLDKISENAETEITNPQQTIEVVGKALSYTEREKTLLLADFLRGGLETAGGILHAVTSAAQRIEEVGRSNDFAATGIQAMEVAHKAEPKIREAVGV